MRFNQIQDMAINRDRLYQPICDRWLPSHPKERYGRLDYWYFRTRFKTYGLVNYDLPLRSYRTGREHNEILWHKVSIVKSIEFQEKFFPIGALLPFDDIFYLASKPLEVVGEKIDLDAPDGFRYVKV